MGYYGDNLGIGADITYRQQVAVLGAEVAAELLPGSDPLGKEIRINGAPFTVIGVMEKKESGGMIGADDSRIIIPVSTAQRLFSSPGVQMIYLQAESPQSVDRAVAVVEAALKYHFRDENAYMVFAQGQILELVNQVTGTMTLMLGLLFSLFVGIFFGIYPANRAAKLNPVAPCGLNS